MRQLLIISPIVIACCMASKSFAAEWSYTGASGPQNWGKIDQSYAACEKGKQQSPIDLTHVKSTNLPVLAINYKPSEGEIFHNGHTVQIDVKGHNTLTINNKVYQLKQFHFHTPSEHTVGKKTYPLEAHFLHKDDEGNIVVLGVMFNKGNYQDPEIQHFIDHMPKEHNVKNPLPQSINLMALLPQRLDYYTYMGSLTAPPCTEGVQWIVLKNKMRLNANQLTKVKSEIGNNNRPTQQLNSRLLVG